MAQDNAAQSIKDLGKDLENLNKKITESIKILESFDVDVADLFAKARESGIANTDKLVDYLAKRLSNLQLKNFSSPFLAAFDEKEIDRAAKKYAALLEKQDVVEKARSIAVGGRKFGELQGEDLKNWREFSSLLATINEQKKQIEQETAGAADAGKKLYDEQLAFKKAQEVQSQEKKRLAQEEVEAKRKAAEDEKQLIKEIKEEEKRAKEEALQRYKEEKAYLDDVEKRKHKTKESELKEAFGQQSKQKLESEMKMNKAVQQQITYYRQLHSLYKEYKALQAKPNKTKEDNAVLEQTKQKILEILRLSKQLELENKGSAAIAKQATEFERVRDRAREARGETQKMQKSLQNLLPTLQRLASAFGVAFSVRGLVQFGKKLIETRGEFEMQFVAMKQIIGDVDAATKIWNQTMQQALQSPFKAMQLVTYTKQLAAYRVETEKLFDTTKRLADVSAGLGVDMGRVILAYGQVKSANFLRASEVRQFTEAGVNIAGQLAEYFSQIEGRAVSTAEVMERITKRMVSFADVEEIFKRMTDEGGQFFKMQEIQTDTVKGQIQKLHDAYDQMLNTIGQANQGTIRNLVDKLNDLVRNWRNIVPLIKSSVTVLGSYIAFTKLAKMGVDRFGDSIVKFRLGKKKQTVEMQAAMVKETLLLNRQAKTINAWEYHTKKALFNVQMAWKALGSIMKSFAPFLAIEGVLYVYNKIMETRREEARLREDLANIRSENRSKADSDVGNYDKLIRRFNELNKGSIERKEIIDKLNSQYGKYLGFIVDETTAYGDLEKAQKRVNLNIRERARLRAEEEAQQRIQEDYIQREAKLLSGKINPLGFGKAIYTFSYDNVKEKGISGEELEKFADYVKTQLPKVTKEVLKNRSELRKAVEEWLNTFYGITGANLEVYAGYDEKNDPFLDLFELYAEQELKNRDEAIKLSEEFKALPKQLQDDLLSMESEWATAMQKLTKAGKGDEVEIPLLNVKLKVPTDLAEKSGVWEVIKEELNRRKEEFKIDLKLNAELITEEQAEELRKQGKSTGSIFIDAVNKELADNILKDAGIEKSFEELKNDIFYNPQNIDDWDKVNHVIELITNNLISASDIVNGTTSYTKELANNLQVARDAINDAVKAQELVADGTQKEKEDAQKLVDKTIERYKWLLKIAKLLGLDTKSADEIVEEEGYDLSVGQFRIAAAQSAFMEKFGKASNAYGKQLSQIGVTENLKEVADAYHKQSDELDGLIKNQEKALENETNLTEEQKENAKTTIENLKEQKSMAEFLAEFFGYVPKKTTTRTTHENASKLISLIKEMRSEYDKLSKSAYGYAKSEGKVRESYKDSVKEILGKAGITDYDFTTNEGMIKALEKVKSYATRLGKDAAAEVQKYIDQLETEITINAQVRIKEDFARDIEKMFSDYELTLNFKSMGLPEDLAKGLFGVDTSSLDEISDYLQSFIVEHEEDWNEDINKIYIDALKKVSDKEQEQYKKNISDLFKRVKNSAQEMQIVMEQASADINFAKMLFDQNMIDDEMSKIKQRIQDNLDEIAKLTPSDGSKPTGVAEQQIARLEAENKILQNRITRLTQMYGNITAEQYTDLIRSTVEWENEQTQKVALDQLKKMPAYLEAMGRTAGWSNTKLKEMLKYLEDIISASGENMSLEDYKTIIGQIDKIQKQIKENNAPFGLDSFAKASQLIKEQEEAEKKMGELENEREQLIEEEERLKAEEVELQRQLNELKSEGNEESEKNNEQIQELLDKLKENQKSQSDNSNKQRKNAAGIQTITANNAQTMLIIDAIIHAVNNLVQEVYQNLQKVETLLQDYSFDTEHGSWAKWSKGMETFAKASQDATNGWEAYKKGDIAGIVYEVINGIVDIWHGINEIVNQKHVDTIYNMEKEIESLQRAYERLEKQIEKTFDTETYMRVYKEETQNLYEQIEALNKQMSAEEAKKNTDADKIQDYKDKIQDAEDKLDELKQKQIDVFGGMGENNYRSEAQGFVDAWKDAFLETGNGLQGLQDHFDEFLQEWFSKQATMRVAGRMLEPLFKQIDAAVDEYSQGGTSVTMQELADIRQKFGTIAPQLSDALEQIAGLWGVGESGSLSGLAAGIQGMTEEQANILEAYWNSVRGYTASIDMNVARIADALGAGGVNTNPQLQQLSRIAASTQAVTLILQSVTKSGHSMGGQGIKVFLN